MNIHIRLPNITAQTETEQLQQIKSYLFQLVGELNWALSALSSEDSADTQTTPEAQRRN